MILLELKHYIKKHQQVTLNNIQTHFDLSEEAALSLLEYLLQQGHVVAIQQSSSCTTQTCHTNCAQPHKTQRYQWSDSVKKPVVIPVHLQ